MAIRCYKHMDHMDHMDHIWIIWLCWLCLKKWAMYPTYQQTMLHVPWLGFGPGDSPAMEFSTI